MFLWGPWKQIKKMCEKDRAIATSVYFVSIGLTLFFAFHVK
jgi:hypothetical protein